MNNHLNNSEVAETGIEIFDTDGLPSLEDLMRELATAEESAGAEIENPLIEIAPYNQTASGAEITQSRETIFRLEQENEEIRQAFERVKSDFEKFRWRAERERSEHYAFALLSIVREFLPILDNFGRALEHNKSANESAESSHFSSGVELIYEQSLKFLADMGIQPVAAVGQPFDPTFHEAVAVEANADLPPNTITAELLRGYKLGEKLIRPAMVKVSG